MVQSFAELKNTKISDMVAPPLIPEGLYHGKIAGPFKEHKTKNNLAADFPVMITAPGDNVDLAELEAAGGLPKKPISYKFWMSENAQFMFGDFARSLGYDADDLMDALQKVGEECPDVILECRHEPIMKDNEPVPDPVTGEPKKRATFQNIVGATA